MKTKKVLFLCTGNSARSQMAEGLLREKGGKRYEAYSAGTQPKGVNPFSIQVMKEIGVDISHHTSKSVESFIRQSFDWVITVCDSAKEKCPIFPGARFEHWDIQDPEDLESFRRVRDHLSKQVDEFIRRRATEVSDQSEGA